MAHGPNPAAPRPPRDGGRRAHSPSHHPAPRNCYAALDLGTNNCRLLIARPADEGFVVVDAFSRIVRLGEGLAATGRLSEAAMDRAVSALSVCSDKLRRRRVSLVRSVATEACRRATNGRAFVERVYRETGIALEVISPEQEARLAVLGCHALIEPGEGNALVFDIGGGSTELILIDADDSPPRVIDWFSAPWGVVSLSETEPHVGADRDGLLTSYARMRARVAEGFAQFAARLQPGSHPGRLLGTSGTVTTLASVHLDLPSYDRRQIDGLVVPVTAMRAISSRLAGMSVSERAELPCIGQERADLVVAGCAILDAILDIWPAERLGVADRGIREGILRSLMARDRARNLM
ncbi:Ppx/GppA phosphatase family protein [Sphingomonadaceae bacterium G21617-S1]|uniref:Ppx/GppA phosphatase family protein n=1 Tax=Rhizorhabdus sp. TaxID=1968843 RepID=UPI0019CCB62B|nr:Ppx/GppA phosphatase family protein [Rhizorhabdus sp.]MBD3761250.1 Ppx/GppA family phosphatase [Rhizorhabdus sp.]MCZ4343729.1 Ppx/GppA phosphatase family protein [Sphingomonadaceae bacterium G21617-S1]